jgi:transposase
MVEAQTFLFPVQVTHKQYEALRAYYVDGLSATEAAQRFGYTVSSFYSLLHQVRSYCGDDPQAFARYFFSVKPVGRKPKEDQNNLAVLIVALRQQQQSVPEIKALLDTLGHSVSEGYISNLLRRAGFPRLPRRTQNERACYHQSSKTGCSLK